MANFSKKCIYKLSQMGLLKWMPDKQYLKLIFRANLGKKLNLDNPRTYNEKLQWIKLYDHNPEYTMMVDKYLVRDYIKQCIGEQYLIPLLGGWQRAEDIDFDKLPDRFALKCNHDSGSIIICKDKSTFNRKEAVRKLNKHLRTGTFSYGREWPYKDVKPCIIAEQYMEDTETGELRDYKFFVFNGVVKALFIATDRQNESKPTAFDFFDAEYNHLDIQHGHPNADFPPEKPKNFEEMKILSERLSKNIPELRVDFYQINGKTYFGELTFFHHSGLVPFDPYKWDEIFGSYIELPQKKPLI